MVTRYTRLFIFIQVVLAIALYFFATMAWGSTPWFGALFGLGSVTLIRLLINANNFRLARRYRSATPIGMQLDWQKAAQLFLTEFAASMVTTSWAMPFHSFGSRPASNPAGLPVLLIHGYGCNSGYWHSFSKRLTRENMTHHAVDLEPVLGSIDGYVPALHLAIEALCKTTGQDKIIIVAHSMGGLAARAYLRAHGTTRIARVVTIGTPHHGTGLANTGVGLNSRQMEWTGNAETGTCSEWLRQLEQDELPATRTLFVSIYSHHDNIVSPQTSSHLAGAVNVELHGIGHVALGSRHAIQDRIVSEIQAASLARLQPALAAA
jgi:triacylglycerol lipase